MRDVESMPGRIEAWLAVHARPGKVERYELMTGGFSRVMARVTIAWDDGGSEVLVLRGDPPPDQATLSSDRDAEWALLRCLTELASLPVPAARWYVDDEQWFGTKALFLDHLPSTTLQAQLEAGSDPDAATTGLCQLMADVAAIGPEALPGVPCPSDWDAYIDAKLAAWRAIADEHVEALPVIRYLVAWMDAHRPPQAPFRLVHGDLQAANVLVTPDGAWHLIDWEFARIGDPREDLGYYNAYSGAVPPNLVARDVDAFLAGFRERTGLDEELVNPATFAWFTILSTLFAVKGLFDGVAARGPGRALRHARGLQRHPRHPRAPQLRRRHRRDRSRDGRGVIARPTTQQLLDDCAREVRDTIMPIVDDPAVRVRLEMLEQLLSSCAVRAAHEMAWMAEECERLERFAADVVAVFPDADEVSVALDEYRRAAASPTGSSLHLDDRVRLYDLAGQAFGAALEVAMASGHAELAAEAKAVIHARVDREAECRPGFYFPGRS